jgi:hypothetical protein
MKKPALLLHRSLVEGISLEDRRWLDAHVGQCVECGRYADLSARAVRALGWFALELDPAAALRVENVVRSRAEGMRSAEAHARSLWIGTAVAIFLTFTGSAVTWRPVALLASQWNFPSRVSQIVFVAFWLLPSLLLCEHRSTVPILLGRRATVFRAEDHLAVVAGHARKDAGADIACIGTGGPHLGTDLTSGLRHKNLHHHDSVNH